MEHTVLTACELMQYVATIVWKAVDSTGCVRDYLNKKKQCIFYHDYITQLDQEPR